MNKKKDKEIKIRLVTDKKELFDKGHDYPVIELYNDYIDIWISMENLSFDTIQSEIKHIENVTGWAIKSREELK